MKPRHMSIKTLAQAAGETVETIQLCEREGLLGPSTDRGYGERALAVIRLMRLGQRLRVPLDEIKVAAALIGEEAALHALLRSWVQRRLGWIAREQEDLKFAQAVLLGFLARSKAGDGGAIETACQDLSRLHRDLGGASDAVTDAAAGRAPDRPQRPLKADGVKAGAKVKTGGPPSVGVHFTFTLWPIARAPMSQSTRLVSTATPSSRVT